MKAEDNPYPFITLVEQASAPATPAAGKAKIYRGTDNKNYILDDGGASTELGGGGGGSASGVIACTAYAPATLAAFSATSTTPTDCDATNMAVTFMAPSSGKVLVRLSAAFTQMTAGKASYWALREGTSTVGSPRYMTFLGPAAASDLPGSAAFLITGLTPGSSHTYKWAHSTDSGGTTKIYAGGVAGQAVMEVHAVP